SRGLGEVYKREMFPVYTGMQPADVRYTFPRRGVLLRPVANNIPDGADFRWSINGSVADNVGPELFFTPSVSGEYRVRVEAEGVSADVTVVCVDCDESARYRPATAGSLPSVSKVWEYMPAPGQFIGDGSAAGGMSSGVTTADAAATWAKSRIDAGQFVSLGAWGGYIVVGFDHSIPLSQSVAEIAVAGNAFKVSNEPGTVWVMQDVNGNGLPDDEWYQLKGSEWGNPLTLHDYSVTYYKPAGVGTSVEWTDNRGNRGFVDYLSSAHGQRSYYPAWATAPTLTFRGICLPANGTCDPVTGQWSSAPFAWGYADNLGSDTLSTGSESAGGEGQSVGLRISNAVYADGSPVALQYVDFVMIQSGLMQQLGVLGESSTEVCGVADNTMSGS
ncbi:MAG: cell surface protein, partial [Paramuribaculum sp.]|nr:cell surface protein [Paramuribaculum sp.]